MICGARRESASLAKRTGNPVSRDAQSRNCRSDRPSSSNGGSIARIHPQTGLVRASVARRTRPEPSTWNSVPPRASSTASAPAPGRFTTTTPSRTRTRRDASSRRTSNCVPTSVASPSRVRMRTGRRTVLRRRNRRRRRRAGAEEKSPARSSGPSRGRAGANGRSEDAAPRVRSRRSRSPLRRAGRPPPRAPSEGDRVPSIHAGPFNAATVAATGGAGAGRRAHSPAPMATGTAAAAASTTERRRRVRARAASPPDQSAPRGSRDPARSAGTAGRGPARRSRSPTGSRARIHAVLVLGLLAHRDPSGLCRAIASNPSRKAIRALVSSDSAALVPIESRAPISATDIPSMYFHSSASP